MDDEIKINTIEWVGPEYNYEEKHPDWIWTIGFITVLSVVVSLYFHSYLFAVFLLVSGFSLILFSIKKPRDIRFVIEKRGIIMGRDQYDWKRIKGFDIKRKDDNFILLIEINKYMLPVYSIPIPEDLVNEIKESLLKVSTKLELEESKTLLFMEKLGF